MSQPVALPISEMQSIASVQKSSSNSGFSTQALMQIRTSVALRGTVTARKMVKTEQSSRYSMTSLINHSCRPNAVVSLGSSPPRAKLYAIAIIPIDEDIVIEYCATGHLFLSGRQTDRHLSIQMRLRVLQRRSSQSLTVTEPSCWSDPGS